MSPAKLSAEAVIAYDPTDQEALSSWLSAFADAFE